MYWLTEVGIDICSPILGEVIYQNAFLIFVFVFVFAVVVFKLRREHD